MQVKRFLQHIHAAEAALWDDNREVFEGIAHEIAARYGIPPADSELVALAVREALWVGMGDFVAAERRRDEGPTLQRLEAAMRRTAYRAAIDAAIELLPDEQRLRIVEHRRARRRKSQSSDSPSVPN